MAYTPTVYTNDNPPALNADNLNHMEQGIYNNDVALTELENVSNADNVYSDIRFNIWNELWEVGSITDVGVDTTGNAWRSKGYVHVLPNTTYYIKGSVARLFYYGSDYSFISKYNNAANMEFTTPNNCHFIRFRSAVTTEQQSYGYDVCINVSQPNVNVAPHNGQYVPAKTINYVGANVLALNGIVPVLEDALTDDNNNIISVKEIQSIIEDNSEEKYSDVSLSFEDATGYYSKTGNFNTYSNIKKATVSVTEGEKYLLSSYSYFEMARAVFLDSNNNVLTGSIIWTANNNNFVENTNVVVPKYAITMIIQAYSGKQSSAKLSKQVGVVLNPVRSILNGKKISVIGDSITAHNWRAKTNWAMYIKDWTKAEIQNLGISGTGFAKEPIYYDRISEIQATPDIIGIALSWNDLSAGLEVGEITDTGSTTLCGLANQFLDALITAYPATPIISYSQGPWSFAKPGVTVSDTWIEKYAQICAIKGVAFYPDLYKGSALKPWISANQNVYYTSDDDSSPQYGTVDNVHPNSEGHKIIARYLYPIFAKNVVDVGMDYQ